MDAALWSATKARLEARGLWGAGASLSLRVAGDETMWLGDEHDAAPRLLRLAEAAEASIHRAVYAARADVGAVAVGGGVDRVHAVAGADAEPAQRVRELRDAPPEIRIGVAVKRTVVEPGDDLARRIVA